MPSRHEADGVGSGREQIDPFGRRPARVGHARAPGRQTSDAGRENARPPAPRYPAGRHAGAHGRGSRRSRRAGRCCGCPSPAEPAPHRPAPGSRGSPSGTDRTPARCRLAPAPGARAASTSPLTRGSKSPPHAASSVSRVTVKPGPTSVISTLACVSSLPTSQLARRWETSSITPLTGTPKRWYPHRPRSCTVVRMPARSIFRAIGLPPRRARTPRVRWRRSAPCRRPAAGWADPGRDRRA